MQKIALASKIILIIGILWSILMLFTYIRIKPLLTQSREMFDERRKIMAEYNAENIPDLINLMLNRPSVKKKFTDLMNEQYDKIKKIKTSLKVSELEAKIHTFRSLHSLAEATKKHSNIFLFLPSLIISIVSLGGGYLLFLISIRMQKESFKKSKIYSTKNHQAIKFYKNGCDYTLSKELDKAIECYNKAIEIDKNFAEAYFGKGICYHLLEDKEQANKYIVKAINLGCSEASEYLKSQNQEKIKVFLLSLTIMFFMIFNSKMVIAEKITLCQVIEGDKNKDHVEICKCMDNIDINDIESLLKKDIWSTKDGSFYKITKKQGYYYINDDFQNPYSSKYDLPKDSCEKFAKNINKSNVKEEKEKQTNKEVIFDTKKFNKGLEIYKEGNELYNNFKFHSAIAKWDEALDIFIEIVSMKAIGVAVGDLSNVYKELGDYRRAIEYYEKALSVAEEIGDKNAKSTWLKNLGVIYYDLGDYSKAIEHYEKALSIAVSDKNAKITCLKNLGVIYYDLGDYSKAIEYFEKTIYIQKEISASYYDTELNLANVYLSLNRDEEALTIFNKYNSFIRLGLYYLKKKDFLEAKKQFDRYREKIESNRDTDSMICRWVGLGLSCEGLKEYEEAYKWFKKAIDFMEDQNFKGKTTHFSQIEAYEGAVRCSFMLNRFEDAFFWTENKRGRIFSELIAGKHPQYAAIKYSKPVKLSQIPLKKGETIVEYEVTDAYTIGLVVQNGKIIKAFKINKTRAELNDLVKKYRDPFQNGHEINEFSLNIAKNLTDLLLKPVFEVVQNHENLIIIPDESLCLIPFESLIISAPEEDLAQEKILRKEALGTASCVNTYIWFDEYSDKIKDESQKQMKEILSSLNSEELKTKNIRIVAHTYSSKDPSHNLKLSLKRAKAVCDYLVQKGIQENRLIFEGKGDTEPIESNQTEKGRMQNNRVELVPVTQRSFKLSSQSQINDLAYAIENKFISFAKKTNTYVIKKVIYAIDQYLISYYQSASVLALHRNLNINRTKKASFFGLGDPIFNDKDDRSANLRSINITAKKTGFSSNDIINNAATKEAGYFFPRLENTGKEVKEVSRLFNDSIIFVGLDASESQLKNLDMKNRRYVLLSTHGILGNEIPYIRQPALVLNLFGNDVEDGFLTASEIFNMNFNADLVVLSECKTGFGVHSAGEGIMVLSRAFMYAGTDSVLVSLWSVSDDSTYEFMMEFFNGLKKGKDKLTALNDAKNFLRKNGYENPFYWAPFILIGEIN